MKATCPKSETHKEFYTVVHVMQEWKVTSAGEFIEVSDESLQTTHGPTVGNIWTCATCGTDAKVEG
jgi:hypothetical protein